MNLLDLVDKELERMYKERDRWFELTAQCIQEEKREEKFRGATSGMSRVYGDRFKELEVEIKEVRKKIFGQVENYDKKIQEKIAEMALTGSTNDKE